jgi:hypothetical protein
MPNLTVPQFGHSTIAIAVQGTAKLCNPSLNSYMELLAEHPCLGLLRSCFYDLQCRSTIYFDVMSGS